jgi:hypothetical protein
MSIARRVAAFAQLRTADLWRNNPKAMVFGAALIAVLCTFFYFPALVLHRTLGHGDISVVDAPVFTLLARVFSGKASILWSSKIFGGFPLYADGLSGFAHPFNIFWATVVTPVVGPIYSRNLFYWLIKIFGGIGVMGLCRTLGASFWAATFAALVVTFSPLFAYEQYAIPVFHTLTWIPWCLWALEEWLKRPCLFTTVILGTVSALVCLCGYPQGVHGTVIYILVTLLITPFQPELQRAWRSSWGRRTTLGLLAVVIGLGLSSVTIMPLLEFTAISNRSGGIGLAFGGTTPLASYLRGFLFTGYTSNESYYPGTGSLLVFLLASGSLLLSLPARVKGHMLGVLVLLILGTEEANPIFRFLYRNHLVPGLHYFRETTIYLGIASIGVAILAAFTVDRLSRFSEIALKQAESSSSKPEAGARRVRYVLLPPLWLWALFNLVISWIVVIHVAIVGMACAAYVRLAKNGKHHLAAPVFTAILTLEILVLRIHPFNFYPSGIFAEPPNIAAIKSFPDWREYKVMTTSLAGTAALDSPRQSDLVFRIRQIVAAIAPMTNLFWKLPSIQGYFALVPDRYQSVEGQLRDEILDKLHTPPGCRLIDFLGIRFITNGGPLATPGFRIIYADQRAEIQTHDSSGHWTMLNEAALPRFQFYSHVSAVDSLAAAIAAIKGMSKPTLIIENPGRLPLMATEGSDDPPDPSAHYKLLTATDTDYRLELLLGKPQWLFFADTDFPGWTATLDGAPAPIFPAQILGKAIAIPAGHHELVLRFRPLIFYVGLIVTLATLGAVTVLLGTLILRNRPIG